jgi:predicted dehydrogenase
VVRPTWRHRSATAGGGAMMDLGVQTLDLALWLLGFPAISSVIAHMHQGEVMEVEDTAAAVLRLANGGAVTITVSWSLVSERDRHYLRVLGTRGSGAISPISVYKEIETGLLDVTPNVSPARENPYTASYRHQLSRFMDMVRGEAPRELPHEQIELMRIVALAYESARERREVGAQAR